MSKCRASAGTYFRHRGKTNLPVSTAKIAEASLQRGNSSTSSNHPKADLVPHCLIVGGEVHQTIDGGGQGGVLPKCEAGAGGDEGLAAGCPIDRND